MAGLSMLACNSIKKERTSIVLSFLFDKRQWICYYNDKKIGRHAMLTKNDEVISNNQRKNLNKIIIQTSLNNKTEYLTIYF